MSPISELAYVATCALGAVGIDEPLEHWSQLSGGLMNITLRAGQYVVRLRSLGAPASSQLFAAERWTGPIAKAAGIATPRLFGVTEVNVGAGWAAAVFEAVSAPRFDNLAHQSHSATIEAARRWGNGLARLHALPCKVFGTLLDEFGTDSAGFAHGLLSLEIQPLAAIDRPLARKFDQMIATLSAAPENSGLRPSYVHGDVHGRNILVPAAGEPIWLDWEACRRRMPEFDFAQLPYTTWRNSMAIATAFIDGYLEIPRERPLSLSMLHACQVYWHIRFGLFLTSCSGYDHAYFGTPLQHFDIARELFASPPAQWMKWLCAEETPKNEMTKDSK